MKIDPALQTQALATIPSLRAFAMSLCGDLDRVNDLVQETLLRAFTHIDSFRTGSNMRAWLFTILRNNFREEYRKRRREVEDADGRYAEALISHPEQPSRLEFEELGTALAKLPTEQRRAVILVGALDFSYDEAGRRLQLRGWHHQESCPSWTGEACRPARDRRGQKNPTSHRASPRQRFLKPFGFNGERLGASMRFAGQGTTISGHKRKVP
jgi:RNA polymerase sigma-70 factor, ECF subfamily